MDYLNRYVTEVGKHLPAKMRPDLEKELHSLLSDMLEDRSQAAGKPVDEEMVLALLQEYGSPEKVAASYLPERYLIGPRLFPNYIATLKLVLGIVAVLAGIGFGISMGRGFDTPAQFGLVLAEALAGLWSALIQAAGIITLIFALVEWGASRENLRLEQKGITGQPEWDPRSLAKEPEGYRVPTMELIWNTAFTTIAIILVAFYPAKIGIYFVPTLGSKWEFIPLLSEAFYRYQPMLILLWGAQIIHNLIALRHTVYRPLSQWFGVALSIFTIAVLAAMLAGPSPVEVSAQALMSAPTWNLTAETAGQIVYGINLSVRIVMGLALFGTFVDLIRRVIRIIRMPQVISLSKQ